MNICKGDDQILKPRVGSGLAAKLARPTGNTQLWRADEFRLFETAFYGRKEVRIASVSDR